MSPLFFMKLLLNFMSDLFIYNQICFLISEKIGQWLWSQKADLDNLRLQGAKFIIYLIFSTAPKCSTSGILSNQNLFRSQQDVYGMYFIQHHAFIV